MSNESNTYFITAWTFLVKEKVSLWTWLLPLTFFLYINHPICHGFTHLLLYTSPIAFIQTCLPHDSDRFFTSFLSLSSCKSPSEPTPSSISVQVQGISLHTALTKQTWTNSRVISTWLHLQPGLGLARWDLTSSKPMALLSAEAMSIAQNASPVLQKQGAQSGISALTTKEQSYGTMNVSWGSRTSTSLAKSITRSSFTCWTRKTRVIQFISMERPKSCWES